MIEFASQALVEAAARLSIASSLESITQIVTTTARSLVGADGSTFVLRAGDLCYYYNEDAVSALWKGKKFPMAACISGWSMIHKKSVIIPDIYKDARIPHDAYRPTFVRSLCMVPIRKSSPIGAIGTYWKNTTHPNFEEVEFLQMKDNGVGIDPSDAGKLFKPLSRLHDDKRYPGLGLGLYSVSKIIELHGGKIRVDGKLQEGATFYFTLPTA